MSKFNSLNSYPAAPGCCVSCGSTRTPTIDTSVSVDYYGAVYFCYLCAQEIGRAAGLVDKIEDPVAEVEADEDIYDVLKYIRDDINTLLDNVPTRFKVAREPEATDPKPKPAPRQISDPAVSKKPSRVPDSPSDELSGLKFS